MSYSTESIDRVLSRLGSDYPGVKLLALGQTVFWDEPMKAILRRHLDQHCPEAVLMVGIQDADYFSRVPSGVNLSEQWELLPHNDGSTKDLWVATGEISRLFGSETLPTRDLLARYGAQLEKIARDYPGGRDSLIDTVTEAWGWRGLVHRDSSNETSCCIPLKTAFPHLIRLLEWAFSHTIDSLAEPASASVAQAEGRKIVDDVRAYAESHPEASVTDLFHDLMHRFYTRLLGYEPRNLVSTDVTDVFNFNKSTANLPRYNLLRLFLDPATSEICRECYDLALEGSDINLLDRFCPGAIPFDLLVHGLGRGTICLEDGAIRIDFDEPVVIPVEKAPSTPEELAEVIEKRFGAETALVGKALTLVLMMSSEFIFVLHEQASAYVPYCEKMAALLSDRGLDLPFYPILRMRYSTWDSLRACDNTFCLPGHMASAFRQGEITSVELADSWEAAVKGQEELLERLASVTGTEALLEMLASHQADAWRSRMESYTNAVAAVRALSERTEPLKLESVRLRDLSHQIKKEVQALELEKGNHFRSEVKPRMDELADLESEGKAPDAYAQKLTEELGVQQGIRTQMESRIESMRSDAQDAINRSLDIKHTVKSLETGKEAITARTTIKTIEYEAELSRLWLVRDAILVSEGLKYTNHRPSAWWFLLADPELRWFNRVMETVEFRFEEIRPSQG